MLVQTFGEYAKAFPESGSLQAFRFQIAQAYWRLIDNAYWRQKAMAESLAWLNEIIEEADGQDSFYADLAKRRQSSINKRP